MKKIKLMSAALATGVLALCSASSARWARVTEPVPTERLIANISDYVKKNPKDAHGYYVLGRVHSLAWATTEEKIEVIPVGSASNEDKNLPSFARYQTVRVTRDATAKLDVAAIGHLRQSVQNYQNATQLDLKNALYFLGYGWMLEQGAPFTAQADIPFVIVMPPIAAKKRKELTAYIKKLSSHDNKIREQAIAHLQKNLAPVALDLSGVVFDAKQSKVARRSAELLLAEFWRENSMRAYRRAFALHAEAEKKNAGKIGGDSAIAYEAGQGILRLLALKTEPLSIAEQKEKTSVTDALKTIEAQPMAVTPILIPLGAKTKLDEILAPEKIVSFDLAGDGNGARWSWVSSDAGILVYDPQSSGKITSGRQLFGSATWWMFWNDGFQAMAALDDNGNDWLEGRELSGLAIWRDANGNGVSDAGEVLALRECGVEALAVRADGRDGKSLMSARGCRMRDGSFRPTYDWIATPLAH